MTKIKKINYNECAGVSISLWFKIFLNKKAPFFGACICFLKFCIVGGSWIRDNISDIAHSGGK